MSQDPGSTLPDQTMPDLPEAPPPAPAGPPAPSSPPSSGPVEATLVVVQPPEHGGRLELRDGDKLSAGRGAENPLVIYHAKVSKVHFRLVRKDGRTTLVDTSSNGVRLNGKKLETRKADLEPGTEITAGPFLLRYLEGEAHLASTREATMDDARPQPPAARPVIAMPQAPEPVASEQETATQKSTWSGRLFGWMKRDAGKPAGGDPDAAGGSEDDEDAMRTKGA